MEEGGGSMRGRMGIMGGQVDLGKGCVGVLFRVADIRVCKGEWHSLESQNEEGD